MRILFYNHEPEVSGAERMLMSTMLHARESGHTTALITPPGALADLATQHGIPVRPIRPLVLGYTRNPFVLGHYMLQSVLVAWQLRRGVDSIKPDLLYANSVRAGLASATAVSFLAGRPALVVHLHDSLGASIFDRCIGMILITCADRLIAISGYVARSVGQHANKVEVVYNGIDTASYRRDVSQGDALRCQLGIGSNSYMLAVAGQITPWKGQLEAIEALAIVRSQVPDTHLAVAGLPKFVGKHRRYDTVAYFDILKIRATREDVAGHVHFLGEVPDVGALFSAADLVLVPSFAEPFGRVAVEAMAAGCPVLATRAGGMPEIITHGVNGWLVPPRDPDALARAALGLLAAPDVRERLAREGYATVTSRFSLVIYTERLQQVWRSVATL